MPDGWRESTWGEEVTLNYGKAIRGYQDGSGPYRVFGSNGPVGWHTEWLARGPGVILGRKGAYRGVRYSREPFFVIDTAYFLTPKSEMDMRWLYYAVIHNKLGEIDDGSPIPSTTRAAVYVRPLEVPPIQKQHQIASILGSLDDKIELNRQINATMEAMAQAIFRDWFVDFGATRRKMEGATDPVEIMGRLVTDADRAQQLADLFPAKIGDNGLPEGWEKGPLGAQISVKRGGSPRPIQDFIRPEGLPWVKIADATRCDGPNLFETREFIREEGLAKTVKLAAGSLILSNSATPGLPKFLRLDACIHDGWLYFPKTGPYSNEYLYLLFLQVKDELVSKANGSVFSNLKTDTLKDFSIVYAHRQIYETFDSLVRPLFEAILTRENETRTLADLRDLLLSKLMTGELLLREAEEQLEAAQ